MTPQRQTATADAAASSARHKRRPILAVLSDEASFSYRRETHLPGLVRLMPREIEDPSEEASLRILQLLKRALRMERQRGRAGHWTYDVNRHLGLVRAYKAEQRLLLERRQVQPGQAESSSRYSGSSRWSTEGTTKS
ncbi:MAG: hypothetical protein AB7U38_02570 [Hyphomicrobiales bacterium]